MKKEYKKLMKNYNKFKENKKIYIRINFIEV